mmetsp:Transcript_110871/g.196452  ORF Transcript_110871/g.196452 Transcript_110871/m.196452 type:complete len:81 (-) Transcript_110871:1716-1958(-)
MPSGKNIELATRVEVLTSLKTVRTGCRMTLSLAQRNAFVSSVDNQATSCNIVHSTCQSIRDGDLNLRAKGIRQLALAAQA